MAATARAKREHAAAAASGASFPRAKPPAHTAVGVEPYTAAHGDRSLGRDCVPFISSNPSYAAAVGARGVYGASSSSHNPIAALVQLVGDVVEQRVAEALKSHGTSAAAGVTAGARAAATSSAHRADAGQGVADAAGHGIGTAQEVAGNPPKVRGVPKLGSWQSLLQMVQWYMEVGDVTS